jgi:hypothetical protein
VWFCVRAWRVATGGVLYVLDIGHGGDSGHAAATAFGFRVECFVEVIAAEE